MQTMREDAETILREAVAAAQPGRLVREALAAERLTGRIVLLAAGRAGRPPRRRIVLRRGSFMLHNGKSLDFKRFLGIEKVHRNSIRITVDLWQMTLILIETV